ncbi:MAG: response regulator [Halobacteriales archaeon]|nr:response regulator [Halobacteriales archaeon]
MGARILIVDDEADVRESLRDLLAAVPGYQVATASTVGEARRLAELGTWDLVISDERLPDGEGALLLAELAVSGRASGRVLMSAYEDFDGLMRGVNAGRIDHFVRKPFDPLKMLTTVERIVRERRGRMPLE